MINGLHHVTAVTSKAQENLDFYTGVLGMRLVKRTVNQDDVSAYHLFYGDKMGNAGTELTFFDWPAGANRNGAGSIACTYLRVPSSAALDWWAKRLTNNDIDHSGITEFHGHKLILFADPEGQELALVDDEGASGGEPWEKSPVPAEYAIRGLYANLLIVRNLAPMADIMTQLLGYTKAASYPTGKGTVTIFAINSGGAGNEIYIEEQPTAMNGFLGHGGVHHIAFRVADSDEQEQVRQRLIAGGLQPTTQIDRFYFKSIYFRTPGGQLFEVATDGPGFATDEDLEHLGESVALPPFLEPHRKEIETGLKPIFLRAY